MKNIKVILASLVLAVFAMSCETDGGTSNRNIQEGAIPNFTLNSDLPTILNLNELNDGNDINFGFTLDIEQGDVASADLVGFYETATGETYGPVTFQSNITEFPAEIILSTSDIISAFGEINSLEDFNLGDELMITTKLYLKDGRELDLMDAQGSRLYGSDILSSGVYDVVANYPVGCPLNGKFTGDYRVTSSSPEGPYGAFANDEFTVTLAETSQTMRTFNFAYLPGLGFPPVNATLEFVCNRVLLQPADAGFGCGGSITFGSADEGASIDFEDESGFTLTVTDFLTDGDCGVASREVILVFEKV